MHFQKTNTLKVLKLSVAMVSKVKNFSVLKVRAIMKLIERGDYLNRLIRLKGTAYLSGGVLLIRNKLSGR